MAIKGLDHANGVNPPSAAAIRADGSAFVYRYCSGSLDPFWTKCLRKPELEALWAGGVSVGYNFERDVGTDTFLGRDGHGGGYAGGQYWARQQQAVNRIVGWPDSWPIVLSADWDATNGGATVIDPPSFGERQCIQIAEFLRGWATVLAEPGLYGGYFTLGAVKRLHPQLVLGWQTVAWSYSNGQLLWQPWAMVHQVSSGHYVAGTNCDINWCFGEPSGLHGGGAPPGPYDNFPILGVPKPGAVRVSSGPTIVSWQKSLNAIFKASPYPEYRSLVPLVVDGVFGPATEERTKILQKIGNTTQDGVVGPVTFRAALFFAAVEKIDLGTL